MTTFYCPSCMEEIDPELEKCPYCGYRLDTDPNQTKVFHRGYFIYFVFGIIVLILFAFFYIFLIKDEPPLTESQYLKHMTTNLTIAGQEANNLNVLLAQLERDQNLQIDETWLARLDTVQKRALFASQQLGSIPSSLTPPHFLFLNERYQLLATANKLDVQLKISCFYRKNQIACQQLTQNKIVLAALFDLVLSESERLQIILPQPSLATF